MKRGDGRSEKVKYVWGGGGCGGGRKSGYERKEGARESVTNVEGRLWG